MTPNSNGFWRWDFFFCDERHINWILNLHKILKTNTIFNFDSLFFGFDYIIECKHFGNFSHTQNCLICVDCRNVTMYAFVHV